jgi:hypothetical protein
MQIFDPTTLLGIHSLLSVIALLVGIPVVADLLHGRLASRTMLFLITAIATDITGALLPAPGFLPSHAVTIFSLAVLAAAIGARYRFGLAGAWRGVYAASLVAAEFFLVFVAIAQSFQKVPALVEASGGSPTPFAVTEVIALAIFVVLGWLAVRAPVTATSQA